MENDLWMRTHSSAVSAALCIEEHDLDNNAVIGPKTLVYLHVYT